MHIPPGLLAHLASRQAVLCFDTPEASKYILHAWRIMVISVSWNIQNPLSGFRSFTFQNKFRRGK